MTGARAFAKINLGLVVGPLRADGKHEIATALQRIGLHDDLRLEPAERSSVEGFDDTIVREALHALAREAQVESGWRVVIEKRIPVAAGLGGGSADAAAALELANATLARPVPAGRLHALAAAVGSDVPFFLCTGAQLATGDGTELRPVALPLDYVVLLVVPDGITKRSTGEVYDDFDLRSGAHGFAKRAAQLTRALAAVEHPGDLAALPPNDLVSSPLATELLELGAFRADVSGAGPVVYGLFLDGSVADRAEQAMRHRGRTFVTHPVDLAR
jgi:4-diphosphocytidyl-2-C-methyl-D-erythritol kinase